VIVVLVFACACEGSSKSAAAPNTPAQLKADKAIAKQAVLKLSDLPPGYKGTPHDANSSNVPSSVARAFATCTGIALRDVTRLMNGEHSTDQPSVDSLDFYKVGPAGEVIFENTVEVDRSSKDLSDPLDHFGSKNATPCWKDFFGAAFDQKADQTTSYRDLTVRKLPDLKIGDQSGAFEATVTISSGIRSAKTVIDFFFVRSGRAGISLFATWIGQPANRPLAQSWVQKVADRLKGAT
jgi:hypothetical protein